MGYDPAPADTRHEPARPVVRRRDLVGPVHWLGGTLALVGVAGLLVRDPHEPGSFGICPVLALTGGYCPGCGSLRAAYDLLHGNVLEALDHNAFLVLLLPLSLALFLHRFVRPSYRPDPARAWLWTRLALGALVVWTVLRNVPVAPFNALAA